MFLEVPTQQDYYTELKLVAVVLARVIEIFVRKGNSVDVHFSAFDDFIIGSNQKFKRTFEKDQFGTSVKFIKFLDKLLSKINKDAPLTISGASGKRTEIFERMTKKHGLVNTVFMSLLD